MPVVYDGVNGRGQGDLFQGLKLWIAHRVPLRSKYVDLVKGNGGQVVALEKNADMLIADHIKKGGVSPPPGSYSWQWIECSVKNGFLEDKNDYLIGRAEGTSRQIGSSEHAKSTRTPFTQKDDLILTKWVLSRQRAGNSTGGNEIYKELERRHPNHTWQSWRDRWVKKLSDRPTPNIPEEELQPEADRDPAPVETVTAANPPARSTGPTRQAQPGKTAEPEPNPSTPQHHAPKPPASMPTSRPGRRGRQFFTVDEDEMLREFIREARARNQPLSGNSIYKEFADTHPNHTWHSWRDRWLRHLSLREPVDDDGPDDASNAAHDEAEDNSEPPMQPLLNPKSDEARLKTQEQGRRRRRAATLLQRTWKGHVVRRDLANLEAAVVDLQSMMRGYLVRMKEAERLNEARRAGQKSVEHVEYAEEGLQEADVDSEDMQQHDRTAREQFYNDLQDYIEAGGKVNDRPSIGGLPIELWQLFRVVTEQDCEPTERNWEQVADELGLDCARFPALVQEVRQCYVQNLADFEETIKAYDNGDDTEGFVEAGADEIAHEGQADGDLATSDAVTAPERPLAEPSSPVYQSSPLAGSKRSRRQSEFLVSDLGYPSDGSRKRRRLNKNTVIPPTPENRLDIVHSRPSRTTGPDYSSPLKSRGVARDEAIEMSSGSESDDLLDKEMGDLEDQNELPGHSELPRKKFVEPETQDWHFGAENEQVFLDPVEEEDVSPSQQLQIESDAFKSPDRVIPSRHVGAKRSAERPSPVSATANTKGTGGMGTRVLRSKPMLAENDAYVPKSSRTPVNGKRTKRALPPQYQRTAASKAAAPTQSSGLGGKTSSQHRPQPHISTSVRQAGPTSLQSTNGSAPPQVPSTSRTTSGPAEVIFDVDYIDAQQNHFQALGYRQTDIYDALVAATFDRGSMTVALDSLQRGGGIPANEPGVWTKRDDGDLRMIREHERQVKKGKRAAGTGSDTNTKVKVWQTKTRLEVKHGKERVKRRTEFMEMLAEAEERAGA